MATKGLTDPLAKVEVQDLTCHGVGASRVCEEDVTLHARSAWVMNEAVITYGTELSGHAGATVQRCGADRPVLHVLSRAGSRLQGSEERAWSDSVDADTLGSEVEGQRTGVGNDSTLGGRVVGQLRGALRIC